MSSLFPSQWMVLYKWQQGKLSAFCKARAERSLGCYFQGHFRELSLIRVSFVAVGSQSHRNLIILLKRGLVGVGGGGRRGLQFFLCHLNSATPGAVVVSSALSTCPLPVCSFFPKLQRVSRRFAGHTPIVQDFEREGEDK